MINLPEVLEVPKSKPANLTGAKWLAGEGAGSWFLVEKHNDSNTLFLVRRFSEKGNFECGGYFKSSQALEVTADFLLTYPSHCQKVTVIQNSAVITLSMVKKANEESDKECLPNE